MIYVVQATRPGMGKGTEHETLAAASRAWLEAGGASAGWRIAERANHNGAVGAAVTERDWSALPKSLARALVAAREYADLSRRGDVTRAADLRRTIEDLVGSFRDGQMILPGPVVAAMAGAKDYDA